MTQTHVVYILRCARGGHYVGHTTDLHDRLRRHNQGTACRFTASRRPVILLWSELQDDLLSAVRRERQLKGWSRAKRQALIAGDLATLRLPSRCRHPRPS
ncbi:MAG: GIY-YIG nuclease family protein [Planctomycetia bacterium]|nr:GIY-YIG nuclease family protein [Planctomycetia bacterium]